MNYNVRMVDGRPTKMMRRKSGGRIGNGLVALSSTAVIAVYGAGYLRTKPAADRLAQQFDVRALEHATAPPAPITPITRVAPSPPPVAPPAPAKQAPKPHPQTYTAMASRVTVDAPPPAVVAADVAPAAAPTASLSASVATDVPAMASEPIVAPPPPVEPVPPPPAPPTTRGTFAKDGTFSGWGSSRHGDIQAAVVIQNGYIVSARITQCLTRYSCSWISHLPGQVISRQSAEVDYVSGATQSTQAFYMAIVQALTQAK